MIYFPKACHTLESRSILRPRSRREQGSLTTTLRPTVETHTGDSVPRIVQVHREVACHKLTAPVNVEQRTNISAPLTVERLLVERPTVERPTTYTVERLTVERPTTRTLSPH